MSSNRAHQKQLARKKKKRELVRQHAARSAAMGGPSSPRGMLRLAATLPVGPAFMSASWQSEDEALTDLVSVVSTRVMPDGRYLPAIVLVDRTCLGVKNAFTASPLTRSELGAQLQQMAAMHDGRMVEASVLEAQSVIYHAIDFARSLGFEPHRDFTEQAEHVVGPRPDLLVPTPLSRPSRPFYVSGPDDNVDHILRQLDGGGHERKFVAVVPSAPDFELKYGETRLALAD